MTEQSKNNLLKNRSNTILEKQELLETIKSSIIEAFKEERKALTVEECAKYTGIGKDKIRELIAKNNTDFPYFKVGVKAIIPVMPLNNWLEKISHEKRQI